VLKSLFLVKPIRREMVMVNQLNDKLDGGGAWRMLGIIDYKVPGFAGGNKKRALEELNKSLAIDSTNPYTYYYLADYYLTIGQKDKAKAALDTLANLKTSPDQEPDLRLEQHRAQQDLVKQL
jgi:tetratricopeptide (TPR) repeat protein